MMQRMHITGMDLNLVVVLHALLEERSVSRAARRLGLSQSATSHALSRLRELLHDPLFVRSRTGLVPTQRAEAMAEAVAQALATLEGSLFAPPVFDPLLEQRTFQVAPSDYVEHLLMAPLLTRLARRAPKLSLWSRVASEDVASALAVGELDLALQPRSTLTRADGLHAQDLWDDHFVCVVRRDHVLARGRLTVERFATADHLFIAPRGQPGGGVVDAALEKLGITRRIVYTTPNFLVAPQVVAQSDLIVTLAARVAASAARTLPLVILEPPFELTPFRISMFWHARRDADPGHRFLREQIVEISTQLSAAGRKQPRRRR